MFIQKLIIIVMIENIKINFLFSKKLFGVNLKESTSKIQEIKVMLHKEKIIRLIAIKNSFALFNFK